MIDDDLALQPRTGLPFYSPRDLADLTSTAPDWLLGPGLAAIGAITEVDGKIKAAGKTTLLQWAIRSILEGTPFLGHPTRATKVIYVTEQSRQTFMDGLRLAGLEDRGEEMRILFREDFHGSPWPAIVAATRQDGYELVVFDTIGKLAGIREENSAGEWATAMAPLQDLAASGRAVVVLRHDRKGGGEVGDSGRGSSQASGDVDIILALKRPEGNQVGGRRVIESLSRYRETPEKIVIELTTEGYVYLGTEDAVAAAAALEFVSFTLGSEFRTNGNALDLKELTELGEAHEPKIKRTQITYALAALTEQGKVNRTGEGKRGDPYRYTPKEADSFRTQTVGNERMNGTSVVADDDDYPASAYTVQ